MTPLESSLVDAGKQLKIAQSSAIVDRAMRADGAVGPDKRARYLEKLGRMRRRGFFSIEETNFGGDSGGHLLQFIGAPVAAAPAANPPRDRSGLGWVGTSASTFKTPGAAASVAEPMCSRFAPPCHKPSATLNPPGAPPWPKPTLT
ncbi:hypothetical protein THIX_60763 [Thiomonas sp. X19]|nr:hypothetical protein [Thiomonas sp. X19]SCC93583.1 hypothetical protein THIX_30811 [Thiomonas sp. X19]SCC93592.1 hypothetical protein THIX_30820 [Thiomonas sp. X19]SCC94705.1 hypothetical protein THIX_60763 [Thiomonas sp. X19]